MVRYTTEEFIKKAKLIHGDKYDYSLVNYTNCYTKVKIICKIHGEFEQIPSDHLSGKGCNKCYGSVKSTTEEFTRKAKLVHGDKYNYSLVNYTGNKIKVKIICKKHGEFEQSPAKHLAGQNCIKCINEKSSKKYSSTIEEFIQKAKLVHGDKYDYSLVNYVGSVIKVKIICPIHGKFEQRPDKHLYGQGCQECYGKKKFTLNKFIEKAKLIHGDKYNYSKVEYKNIFIKIKIICPIHGEFEQAPVNHLKGYGCVKCSPYAKLTNFVDRAKLIHGNKYNYSLVNYVNNKTKVRIICPIHGEFKQKPYHHLNKFGCQKCFYDNDVSVAHHEIIDYLKQFKINNILINDHELIKPNELDIYLPDTNVAIEYNGVYYHSYNKLESFKEKYKHYNKTSNCFDKGIKLIQIFENE
ncbi:MAG: hypothetical protein WC934_15300, partial [Acidithiobacillus sp.]|uniref:hypothetical protein n=1 Tax=Acidithiobacillus sp. TaxID=1872118 RepID=UPI00356092FB